MEDQVRDDAVSGGHRHRAPVQARFDWRELLRSRPLNRLYLTWTTGAVVLAALSDVVFAEGRGAAVLVTLLPTLAFLLQWWRTPVAFLALLPSLVISHVMGVYVPVALLGPMIVGGLVVTAHLWVVIGSVAVMAIWAALIPFITPEASALVWLTVLWTSATVGTGLALRTMISRREEDKARLAAATQRAAEAATQERRSLARDLHDIVAHNLTIIAMQARTAQYVGTEEAAKDAVEVIGDSAREALQDLRRMLWLMQAEGLLADEVIGAEDSREPASAIDIESGLVKFTRGLEHLGIDTRAEHDPLFGRLPRSLETALYRVLQEATTNVAKHSGAGGQCEMSIRLKDGDLHLRVDNTIAEAAGLRTRAWRSSGNGLVGMRDRVEAFGGTLTARREGRWWRLSVHVPDALSGGRPAERPADRR